ncbi:GMC family oxidoreductase N-terminal domain-containing protein [Ancylobacter dichloromethanicus]
MVPTSPGRPRSRLFFHQARVMGGGSSINAQIALRGLPRDFDGWQDAGAEGWNWEAVLPFFRKLEHDVDFFPGLCTARMVRCRFVAFRSIAGIRSLKPSGRSGTLRDTPISLT